MGKAMSIKVGDVMRSSSCNDFTVISVNNSNSILVQFNDEFKYECRANAFNLNKGHIKNPYFAKLFGLGYLGVGDYKSSSGSSCRGHTNTPEYTSWVNMMSRCYYNKYTNRINGYTNYDLVTVDKSWHNFQTFAGWFCNEKKRVTNILPNVDFVLDKDILSSSIKVYSSSTCCLVPVEINTAVRDSTSKVKDNKLSTLKLNKRNTYSFRFYIGRKCIFIDNAKTAKECIEFYLKYKERYVHDLALKYKLVLNPNVYAALMSYELPKRDALLIKASTI
jgi:hypothetical protein